MAKIILKGKCLVDSRMASNVGINIDRGTKSATHSIISVYAASNAGEVIAQERIETNNVLKISCNSDICQLITFYDSVIKGSCGVAAATKVILPKYNKTIGVQNGNQLGAFDGCEKYNIDTNDGLRKFCLQAHMGGRWYSGDIKNEIMKYPSDVISIEGKHLVALKIVGYSEALVATLINGNVIDAQVRGINGNCITGSLYITGKYAEDATKGNKAVRDTIESKMHKSIQDMPYICR